MAHSIIVHGMTDVQIRQHAKALQEHFGLRKVHEVYDRNGAFNALKFHKTGYLVFARESYGLAGPYVLAVADVLKLVEAK